MKTIRYELQTLRQGLWERSNYDYSQTPLDYMKKFVRSNGGYRIVKITETVSRKVILQNKRRGNQ